MDVWTGFLFRMQFVGVTLEFLQSRSSPAHPTSLTRSLARFDIQESEFSFEARSNQCQTVDLTSHSVIGYDTRYEGLYQILLACMVAIAKYYTPSRDAKMMFTETFV